MNNKNPTIRQFYRDLFEKKIANNERIDNIDGVEFPDTIFRTEDKKIEYFQECIWNGKFHKTIPLENIHTIHLAKLNCHYWYHFHKYGDNQQSQLEYLLKKKYYTFDIFMSRYAEKINSQYKVRYDFINDKFVNSTLEKFKPQFSAYLNSVLKFLNIDPKQFQAFMQSSANTLIDKNKFKYFPSQPKRVENVIYPYSLGLICLDMYEQEVNEFQLSLHTEIMLKDLVDLIIAKKKKVSFNKDKTIITIQGKRIYELLAKPSDFFNYTYYVLRDVFVPLKNLYLFQHQEYVIPPTYKKLFANWEEIIIQTTLEDRNNA
jgi:hypothetical protein